MKLSPKSLKLLSAADAVAVAGGVVAYSTYQAAEYDRKCREATVRGEPAPPLIPQPILEFGYWVGRKTGLIKPMPCGMCGLG